MYRNSRPARGATALLMAALVAAAGPASAAPAGGYPSPAMGWAWPLGGPGTLLRQFEAPPRPWAAGHRGVDLRAPTGTAVRSPADGVVAFVGVVVDRPVVTVDHGDGLVSSFEPAAAGLAVGDAVRRGQVLAVAAAGGHCSGTCIHWGLRRDGEYIDPLSMLMDRRPSILLPVPAARGPRGPAGRAPS